MAAGMAKVAFGPREDVPQPEPVLVVPVAGVLVAVMVVVELGIFSVLNGIFSVKNCILLSFGHDIKINSCHDQRPSQTLSFLVGSQLKSD